MGDPPTHLCPECRGGAGVIRALLCGIIVGVQAYCDWCFAGLSADDQQRSVALGLSGEQAWACTRCVDSGKIHQPPESWQGAAFEWPFYRPEPAE